MQICVGRSGPLRPGNGLSLVDRLILSETFLHWSATHRYRLLGLALPLSYFLFGIVAVHADVSDALYHFLPYFIAQTQAVAWLSGSRALPIMGDLSHLLAATSIVKAVWQGLTKPKGQKFVVTAKGGDRSKRFVQTPLLATFHDPLVLTIAGVCHAFILDPVVRPARRRVAAAVLELVQYRRADAGLPRLRRAAALPPLGALRRARLGRAPDRRRPHDVLPDRRHFDRRHAAARRRAGAGRRGADARCSTAGGCAPPSCAPARPTSPSRSRTSSRRARR